MENNSKKSVVNRIKSMQRNFRISLQNIGSAKTIQLLYQLLFSKNRELTKALFYTKIVQEKYGDLIEKNEQKNPVIVERPPKNIFFFWYEGRETMPKICKLCYTSIQKFYPDYNLVFIDKTNLNIFIDKKDIVYQRLLEGTLSLTNFSDYLRMTLIYEVGGIWVDSTLLFLDRFPIEKLVKVGRDFGSVSAVNNEQWLVFPDGFNYTWNGYFVAGSKNSCVAKTIIDVYKKHFSVHKYTLSYFFMDYCFRAMMLSGFENNLFFDQFKSDGSLLYASDNEFKIDDSCVDNWRKVPQKLSWKTEIPEQTIIYIQKLLEK